MFKFKRQRNLKSGFTLVEILVALSILILFGGLSLATISAIPQARMKQTAQMIKSEFELTRNFAKTHGGDASFSISYTENGYEISRQSKTVADEKTTFDDKKLSVFYKVTGDNKEYRLGFDDATNVTDKTLTMTFAQTDGSIIGPHWIDYIIVSNGNKSYKFIIQQSSGMIYYDYEVDGSEIEENVVNENVIVVEVPRFIVNKMYYDSYGPDHYLTFSYTGQSIQPDLDYDAQNIKIGGAYRAVGRTDSDGVYEITFTLKNIYKMRWSDGTTEQKTLSWRIQ